MKAKLKAEQSKSGGKKAPIFYVFKLEQEQSALKKFQWRFVL